MNASAIAAVFNLTDPLLWLVTAQAGDRRSGLIATCVTKASIVPDLPRMLVGLSCQHWTGELATASGGCALHLLGEEQLDWVWRFGLHSGRDGDKFAGLAWKPGVTGSPLLADALGWLDCRIETRWEAGDRQFFLAEVLDGDVHRAGWALTVKRLVRLAPPQCLQQFAERQARDIAIDAPLIREWRQRYPSP